MSRSAPLLTLLIGRLLRNGKGEIDGVIGSDAFGGADFGFEREEVGAGFFGWKNGGIPCCLPYRDRDRNRSETAFEFCVFLA